MTVHVGTFEETVYREIVRSRRHERPLALVVLAPDGETPGRTRLARRRAAARSDLATRAAAHVRRYDYVSAPDAAGRVAILVPEQLPDDANAVAGRLQEALQVPAGAASFVEAGTSLEELFAVAARRAAGVDAVATR